MGIIWPNREFPGNPLKNNEKTFRVGSKKKKKKKKRTVGRTIVNRHNFFCLDR